MANNKSAIKRNRQRDRRRLRNRVVIGSMRTAVKRAKDAITEGSKEAPELIKAAVASIDKAVGKQALKRKTGSRYISRLTSQRSQ